MATLVCFHAHPDDESIATGGVMAKYASAGHRVVLVVATNGEHGEVPDDLAPGEALADRRRAETQASAEVLGLAAVHWLGYEDSGMHGWEQNGNPGAFHNADLEEAAGRLADILRAERADVLTVYDWLGNYGHPDHVHVHRVGHRAAALSNVAEVYEATINRDHVERLMAAARARGELPDEEGGNLDKTAADAPFGMPEAELTTAVDVRAFLDRKRASMACHASQTTDSSFFLQMPPDTFSEAFGTEWFIRRGAPAGIHESELRGLG